MDVRQLMSRTRKPKRLVLTMVRVRHTRAHSNYFANRKTYLVCTSLTRPSLGVLRGDVRTESFTFRCKTQAVFKRLDGIQSSRLLYIIPLLPFPLRETSLFKAVFVTEGLPFVAASRTDVVKREPEAAIVATRS